MIGKLSIPNFIRLVTRYLFLDNKWEIGVRASYQIARRKNLDFYLNIILRNKLSKVIILFVGTKAN